MTEEKYGFVYIWFDRKHKRYYIGCRWGREDDGYICSSSWMMQAFKRRPEDFKRKILSKVYNRKQLLEEEYKWLSKIKPEELGKRYYNLHNHHFGHWATFDNSKSVGLKISNKLKEKYNNFTEEDWKKFKNSRIIPEMTPERIAKIVGSRKHYKHSEETKHKISKSKKGKSNGIIGRICSEETKHKIGSKNAINSLGNKNHLGCSMSETAKKKISEANKGKLCGENNPSKRPEVRKKLQEKALLREKLKRDRKKDIF